MLVQLIELLSCLYNFFLALLCYDINGSGFLNVAPLPRRRGPTLKSMDREKQTMTPLEYNPAQTLKMLLALTLSLRPTYLTINAPPYYVRT